VPWRRTGGLHTFRCKQGLADGRDRPRYSMSLFVDRLHPVKMGPIPGCKLAAMPWTGDLTLVTAATKTRDGMLCARSSSRCRRRCQIESPRRWLRDRSLVTSIRRPAFTRPSSSRSRRPGFPHRRRRSTTATSIRGRLGIGKDPAYIETMKAACSTPRGTKALRPPLQRATLRPMNHYIEVEVWGNQRPDLRLWAVCLLSPAAALAVRLPLLEPRPCTR